MSTLPADADKTTTFEEALTNLEEIVATLEAGDISLEDALSRYEAGVALLKHCYAQLQQAEQRILVLSGENAEGKPTLQPFEDPSAAEQELRQPRGRGKRNEP